MIIEQAIGTLLDETIAALSVLDTYRLEELETRVSELTASRMVWSVEALDKLQPKLILLGEVMRLTEANLGVLRRLPLNERRRAWAL